MRAGDPLDDDERHFLHHLPTHPSVPTTTWTRPGALWPPLRVRDFVFERLCKLAKEARRHDVEMNPDAAREWKFAGAVLQFSRHPMAWLLNWAGIRTRVRGSYLLMACAVTAIVVVFSVVAVAVSVLVGGSGGLSASAFMIAIVVALAAILIASYLVMNKLERWLGRRAVERCRCVLPLAAPPVSS